MNNILQPTQDALNSASLQVDLLQSINTSLQDQLAKVKSRTVYSNLQHIPMFSQDKKIPFQWIQPGNVGNTGGGAADAHGTIDWVLQNDGSTLITIHPKNISPKSDNFFNYCILPYPQTLPTEFTMSMLYGCKTVDDWNKCQQLEGQVEIYALGFQYTMGFAFNPKTVFHYWAGGQKWQSFTDIQATLTSPQPMLFDFVCDYTAHTYLYKSLTIGGKTIPIGKLIPALTAPSTRKEFSVSVQQDGQAAAPSYSTIVDKLTVSHN